MQHTHLLAYLDETAQRLPNKAAFCDDETQLTFSAVHALSCAVGTALLQLGAGHKPVVVFMRKSPRAVAAFFGVLRAGGCYVPLDEEMPRYRIESILASLQPHAVLYDASTQAALGELGFAGERLCFEEAARTPPEQKALAQARASAIDTDPAYVVFTSGSTGKPKGVVASHRAVIDYVEALSATLGFSESTVFGNQAPLYVDACLKELYPTCKFGATTWFVPRAHFSFPKKLIEYLNQKRINTVCWVASAFAMVAALRILNEQVPEHLTHIAFGSEVFPAQHLEAWRKACPHARFWNLYGPTEATGMSCSYELPAGKHYTEGERIPIGHAFANTDVFLLNESNIRVQAPGEQGEICIRGTCLALGYFNDPERTAQSFVQNPLQSGYPERIYRTGDLGQWNEQGELLFVSRKDHQIKRAGYRIELGEIEAAATSITGVAAAVCLFDDSRKQLVLVYAGEQDRAELTQALRAKLPQYMLPGQYHKLNSLPTTPNGKLDRAGLKQRFIGQGEGAKQTQG